MNPFDRLRGCSNRSSVIHITSEHSDISNDHITGCLDDIETQDIATYFANRGRQTSKGARTMAQFDPKDD
jgi:hypothetical protein